MYKVLVLSLAVFAVLYQQTLASTTSCCEGQGEECDDIVCQPCNDYTKCPECFPNGPNQPPIAFLEPCCKQLSQVVALTAASVQAASEAFAAAEACSSAATRVVVAAAAGAAVGAHVSICQSLSVSINTGKCCEISQDVTANATSYSRAFATAAAEAQAASSASARASAASSAASAAAASLYAQAESLIQSTCCGFDLEVYSAVLAAGNYAVSAKACASASVQVSTSAYDVSQICSSAASVSAAGTSSLVSAKIDNCCVSSFTSQIASATAGACLKVCDKANELHGFAQNAYDFIGDYAIEENAIETPVTLIDSICASECSDVSVSCCSNRVSGSCCNNNGATCCLASHAIVDVYLAARAIAEAAAAAVVYAESVAQVYTNTIAVVYTAAQAATGAAASIKVDVQNCCSMVVTVETAALANAKAVAQAVSAAQAAAQSYSYGYAAAQSVSRAVAEGKACASAAVVAYYQDCCGKSCCQAVQYYSAGGRLSCCGVSQNVVSAFSYEYINLVSQACSAVESLSASQSAAATGARASDCTNIIRRVTTKAAFLLQCCCCTTKNVQQSTVRVSYGSTRIIGVPSLNIGGIQY